MKKSHVTALREAIQIAGSQSALADRLASAMKRPSLCQQTVSKWLRNGTLLDAEYWPAFEAVTSNRVTRDRLRPDVFGRQKVA